MSNFNENYCKQCLRCIQCSNNIPPSIYKPSLEYMVSVPINLALCPLPSPRVKLQYATNEEGKFIFPPGGSFLIFLSNPETPTSSASGRVAFGWWEEPI